MTQFLDYLRETYSLDLTIFILVLAAGSFQKQYLKDVLPKISGAIKTLIVSLLFTLIFLLVLHLAGKLARVDLAVYFITYAVATSFYEIFNKGFMRLLKKNVDNLTGGEQ